MHDLNDAGILDPITGKLLLGYVRVGTGEQDLTNQRAELRAADVYADLFRETRRDATRSAGAARDA